MAKDLHDDLDEMPDEPAFEIAVDEPPPRRTLNLNLKQKLKPILIGLGVLILGGGLGFGVYLFTAYDTRDLIGLLDLADSSPRLAMELPGRGGEEAPPKVGSTGSGLLTPPAVPGAASGVVEKLKAVLDDSPVPESARGSVPEGGPGQQAAAPPLGTPSTPPTSEPLVDPSKPVGVVVKAPSEDTSGIPFQPNPRTAEKPPSFDTLAARPQATPLPAAPVKEMLRKTQAGDLPYPGPDGRQPWQVYGRPWSGPADKGKVAVVVVDMGLDKAATEAAIAKLPPDVTLAFSPYAPSLDKWVKKARDFGHEVLLMLPAEAGDFPARDPGPFALLTALSPEANLTRFEAVLSKAAGYSGVISLGNRFGGSEQMTAILGRLRDHGLLYLGDGSAPADRLPPQAVVSAVVDQDLFREAIDIRLSQVGLTGRAKGRAVAVLRPRPLSFDRLLTWIITMDAQGVVLAPASMVVQPPPAPGKS
ncbi:Skin secretory protein xP2 [Candidatus Terasakiella magnetica]|nr:Skin secretory protein xP2 [Candidatus Terasakiella magnetica]